MKRIKNILKSKRGIALENAILFLITTFTLCAMLTTFTLIGRYQANIENTVLKRRVAVEQIGENFVNSDNKKEFIVSSDTYGCSVTADQSSDPISLKVFHKSNESKILLYVKVSGDTVVEWVYNPAETTE